ncbi:MAG: hypothetical protein JKY09_00280 [Crocinitomicaceae bacterium]|nr:hypothetical protein [Crocinitomicaceae bacterium]
MKNHIDQVNMYDFNYSWTKKLDNPPKVFLMGSSTMKFGLSPSIIAHELDYHSGEVINLAENARSPIQSFYLLNTLDDEQFDSLDLVIYGIDKWIFSKAYYEHNKELLYDLDVSQSTDLYFKAEKDIHFNELLGISTYKRIVGDYETRVDQLDVPIDFGAGVLEQKPKNFRDPVKHLFGGEMYSFSNIQFNYLKKIQDFFQEKGVKLVLLSTPRRSDWRLDYKNTCRGINSEFDQRLKKKMGSTLLLNHYEIIHDTLEHEYFNDGIHLNKLGQKYYSSWFCKQIQEL